MVKYKAFATIVPKTRQSRGNRPTQDGLTNRGPKLWHIGVGVYEKEGLIGIQLTHVYFRKIQNETTVGCYEDKARWGTKEFEPSSDFMGLVHPDKGKVEYTSFKNIGLEARIVDISEEDYKRVKAAYEKKGKNL